MSMIPQVADGQKLCIGTIDRDLDCITRGDLMAFRFPDDLPRSFAKRVAGRSGETVAVHKGEVPFKGTVVSEGCGPPQCRAPLSHSPAMVDQETCCMLGEHRPWGSVAKAGCAGKTVFTCRPPDRFSVVR